jgi:hypothetical protein
MECDFYCYKCKSGLIPGHNYVAIIKIARKVFDNAAAKTKRRPYVRSAYFKGEKIFLDNFWPHIMQKNPRDRFRRLQLIRAGFELIRDSRKAPILIKEGRERLYRFLGISAGHQFYVQIKEDPKRRQKFLMSMFSPYEK